MKTVMILCNSSSGLYDFRNEMILAASKQFHVIVCAPDEGKVKQLAEEGCQIIKTPMDRRGMNPLHDMALFFQYVKLLRTYKPDIVLTYTIKPNVYGGSACRLLRIPYLVNITGLGSVFERGGLLQKMVIAMYRFGLKKANCVFFQNAYNQATLEGFGIRGKKTVLLPGSGVNLEKYPYEAYPKQERVDFLVMARIMKEKGFDEYLACAKEFHSEKVGFHIIGYHDEAAYEEEIEQLQKQGVIQYHGFQEDVHSFLKACSCIVVLSYHEGLSNVILEAAATGRPAIVSRIHGCVEAVDEGVSGLCCDVQSVESAKEAVKKFLSLTPAQREAMGRAAREKMEREFDRNLVVTKYMEEMQDALHE